MAVSARVSEFGGAAFLIPYFICVIVIGFTGVVGEMAFGRAMGAGPMGAFGAATEKAGKGRTPGELFVSHTGSGQSGFGNRLFCSSGLDT